MYGIVVGITFSLFFPSFEEFVKAAMDNSIKMLKAKWKPFLKKKLTLILFLSVSSG